MEATRLKRVGTNWICPKKLLPFASLCTYEDTPGQEGTGCVCVIRLKQTTRWNRGRSNGDSHKFGHVVLHQISDEHGSVAIVMKVFLCNVKIITSPTSISHNRNLKSCGCTLYKQWDSYHIHFVYIHCIHKSRQSWFLFQSCLWSRSCGSNKNNLMIGWQ